jgi:signal transduction histidine kinase
VPARPNPRRSANDALTVVAALAYGALVVAIGDASAPRAAIPWPVDVGVGVACCPPLLWRRRWPVGVAAALVPFGAVSVMATGPVLAAIVGVAVRRRSTAVVLLGLGNVATAPLYYLQQPEPSYPLWVDLVIRPLVTAAAVGWGLYVGARRQLLASLRERAERAEAEQSLRTDAARRAERTRIAREMHDVLGHRLSLVSLHAGALEVRGDAPADEIASAAAVIRATAHEALQELRQVVGVLRDGDVTASLRPQPGLADVGELVASARAAGAHVTFTDLLDGAVPPAAIGRTVYRVVQEALTNARKHAPNSAVEVTIDGLPGEAVRVTATNALPPNGSRSMLPGAGVGLVGLAERVEVAGGWLEHGPDVEHGIFAVCARLPWPA